MSMRPGYRKDRGEVVRRIRRIRMILLDVDGVMTDGGIVLGHGGFESKRFHVQDGMGVTLARMAGLRVGIITGRNSEVVERRARELHVDVLYQGAFDKLPPYEEILDSYGLSDEHVCYMGDDLLDLRLLRRAGLAAAPSNARPEVWEIADYVTHASGGHGAVRELVETIIRGQGQWDRIVEESMTRRKPPA